MKFDDRLLQQATKLFLGETGIADDAAHREAVHRVVPGDREDPHSVSHHDVLTLADDSKADLLKSTHGILVVDTGGFWAPLSGDLDLADHRTLKELIPRREIFPNGVLDVLVTVGGGKVEVVGWGK